ncbi:MAG: PAS domain S-box protein [Chloroflexi bacterium]|nr:PAS domain S-box protein [Chloroflexota bacterium]
MKINSYFWQQFQMDDISDVQQLRNKILHVLLIGASIIGAVIYILAVIPAVKGGVFSAILIYSIFYGELLGITLISRIPYVFRVYGWLFFLYVLGVHNLTHSGFNVDAGLFFLSFVIMAILLLDLRSATIAFLLSLVSISLMGFIIVQSDYGLTIGLSQKNPFLWLVGGTIFLFVGFATTVSLNMLLSRLAENLRKTKEISFVLEQKNKKLLESELHFRNLVEASPSAIVRFDIQGTIEAINPACERLLGYQQVEILGEQVDKYLIGEEKNLVNQVIKQTVEKGLVRDVEVLMQHKDMTPILVEYSAEKILNARGEIVGVIGIGKDITEKRKAEEILQAQTEELKTSQKKLRTLTHQLISAQEDERRVIARELHDDAGQTLVTLKHGLGTLLEELNDKKGEMLLEERLERTLDLADQAMVSIRSASHRLRPPALEVGGIDVILEDLCRRFSLQTGLHIYYEGVSLFEIPEDLVISLYRFAQEALTNTLKHSDAHNVDVRLIYQDDKIILSVEDDGCGTKEEQEQKLGIGLLGLKERFTLFSGEIGTDYSNGQGYLITVTVPWKKKISQ